MSDWKPITSAPEWKRILVWIPKQGIQLVLFSRDVDIGATHWMPLPSPPSDES